ncbi:hypothetical protein M9Y10_039744 [Tritrichomonas musculus]|uniref:Uncharacterized protein n=1 Tax=Tritrichomonas musculus TaxID=1915356 RepID=A0ABR2GRV8_9EUKA
MNKYRQSNTTIVGASGQMYAEGAKHDRNINYTHYGIFANDNTYAVTFNPRYNRPPTKIIEQKPIKQPPSNQYITKPLHEPPTSITEAKFYLNNATADKPPLLPPYLNRPEDLGIIQGLANEKNKGNIEYGPAHKNIITYNIY